MRANHFPRPGRGQDGKFKRTSRYTFLPVKLGHEAADLGIG